jgi:hypothetical protein
MGVFLMDLTSAPEAWLQVRAREGYESVKCVLINMEGNVFWRRGSPGDWNWESTD